MPDFRSPQTHGPPRAAPETVMGNQEDNVFMKRFSLIIVGLVLFTFAIIFIARIFVPSSDDNSSRMAMAIERIQPVSGVYTDAGQVPATPPAAAAAPTAVEPAAGAPTAGPVAASIDGGAIYVQACQLCHMAGAAGAPIPGTDLWQERAAKGLDQLAYNAVNGINAMPAKGGRMDLSDEEVTAAVEYMLAQ